MGIVGEGCRGCRCQERRNRKVYTEVWVQKIGQNEMENHMWRHLTGEPEIKGRRIRGSSCRRASTRSVPVSTDSPHFHNASRFRIVISTFHVYDLN